MGNYALYLIPSGPKVWATDNKKRVDVTTAQEFVDRLAANFPDTFESVGGDPVKMLEAPFMVRVIRATYKEVVPLYTHLATRIDIDVCGAIRRILEDDQEQARVSYEMACDPPGTDDGFDAEVE